jgi:putative glycerol-1-phosphate prenyltransferase
LLYLSLISGRNPELLIGQHVISAPFVKQSGLEIISTGYMVIDGGAPTTVSYISNALPIPSDKNEIAMCTAMAGEMLGMKLIYMDAGSGAKRPINESMIEKVARCIEVPLVIGGGIIDAEKAYLNCRAGADIIVVGNAIEKDGAMIKEISAAIHSVPVPIL